MWIPGRGKVQLSVFGYLYKPVYQTNRNHRILGLVCYYLTINFPASESIPGGLIIKAPMFESG
jgi:hypothetical protein